MNDDSKKGKDFVYSRAYPRAPLRLMVRVRPEGGISRSYNSKNLSAGGIFLLSDEPLEEETQVVLELYLPKTDKPIKLKGEVVWKQRQDPSGFAVKFVDVSDAERSMLKALIPPGKPE